MRGYKGLLALGLILSAGNVHSQDADTRPNPFVKPPTAQEQQLVQDERTKNIVRQMQTEIVDRVSNKFEKRIVSIQDDLKKLVEDTIQKNQPVQQDGDAIAGMGSIQGRQPGKADAKDGKNPLEGYKFISCVNKKALYRDQDNALFQDTSANNRCNN